MRGKLRLSGVLVLAAAILLVTDGVINLYTFITRGPSGMIDVSAIIGILILVAGIGLYVKGK